MVKVSLLRQLGDDQGTPGAILVPGTAPFHALELPWRDNLQRRSCIPEGDYTCQIVRSPRFGRVYHVTGVPGRSAVLIHSGNFAGNIDLGFKSHVEGCILLGEKVGTLDKQRAVLVSRPAVTRFMRALEEKPFTLEIRHA